MEENESERGMNAECRDDGKDKGSYILGRVVKRRLEFMKAARKMMAEIGFAPFDTTTI